MSTHLSTDRPVSIVVDSLLADLANNERDRAEQISRLEQKVRSYEQQFAIPSAEVHQRIEDGLLVEDLAVCDWLMALAILDYERA